MATPSSILAWKTPQTEETGGLQSMGSQRVGHDLVTKPPPPLPHWSVVSPRVITSHHFFFCTCLTAGQNPMMPHATSPSNKES